MRPCPRHAQIRARRRGHRRPRRAVPARDPRAARRRRGRGRRDAGAPPGRAGATTGPCCTCTASPTTSSRPAYADCWIERGYDFYALDLRKYGRSLRPHQTPNYVADLRDYYPELDAAWRPGHRARRPRPRRLSGHSTGGLIGAAVGATTGGADARGHRAQRTVARPAGHACCCARAGTPVVRPARRAAADARRSRAT